MLSRILSLTHSFALISLAFVGCGPGGGGSSGVDCGEHGTEHEGHCHCDSGFLFDGTTCVEPSGVTEICVEPADGEEHHHEACKCPDTGVCPCDGTIETFGGNEYCAPELHED